MKRIDVIIYIIAALLILVPYTIMVAAKKLEPYPAIILPDGSSTAQYNDEYITYSKIELVGIDSLTGQSKIIDKDLFFAPISSNRIYGFVNNSFGIDDVRRDTIRFKRNLIAPIIRSKTYSEKWSQDLNDWYQSKLRAQGLNDSVFTFQEQIVTIDRVSSEIIDSTLSRSKSYLLYD